jgi:hypothetical protein
MTWLLLTLPFALALWRRWWGGAGPDWAKSKWLKVPVLILLTGPFAALVAPWLMIRHDSFGPPGYAARRYPGIGWLIERLRDRPTPWLRWTEWAELLLGFATGAVIAAGAWPLS